MIQIRETPKNRKLLIVIRKAAEIGMKNLDLTQEQFDSLYTKIFQPAWHTGFNLEELKNGFEFEGVFVKPIK